MKIAHVVLENNRYWGDGFLCQRISLFSSAATAGLAWHHLMALDGAYAPDEKGEVHFRPVAPPSDKEVARIAGRIARRIERLMTRLGMTPSGSETDAEFGNQQPLLAEPYSACNPIQPRNSKHLRH